MRFVEPIIDLKDHKLSKSKSLNDINRKAKMTIYRLALRVKFSADDIMTYFF